MSDGRTRVVNEAITEKTLIDLLKLLKDANSKSTSDFNYFATWMFKRDVEELLERFK